MFSLGVKKFISFELFLAVLDVADYETTAKEMLNFAQSRQIGAKAGHLKRSREVASLTLIVCKTQTITAKL